MELQELVEWILNAGGCDDQQSKEFALYIAVHYPHQTALLLGYVPPEAPVGEPAPEVE